MSCLLRRAAVLAAAVVILHPAAAGAEIRRAEFTLAGMDCAYCNGAMSTAIKKLDGVESVELIAAKGVVVVRLKADNTITLPQLRRVIKSVGYDAKDADITARGRLAADGKTFDLLNGSVMQVAGSTAGGPGETVEATGVARAGEKDAEILTIAAIKQPG